MSVIVKGMEMPKDCSSCWIPSSFCKLWFTTDVGNRNQDCPLVELPKKHGRLIEAGSLKETLDYYIRESWWGERANQVLGWVKDEFIDSERTVVEAEGE